MKMRGKPYTYSIQHAQLNRWDHVDLNWRENSNFPSQHSVAFSRRAFYQAIFLGRKFPRMWSILKKTHYPEIKNLDGGGYPTPNSRSLKEPRVFGLCGLHLKFTFCDGERSVRLLLDQFGRKKNHHELEGGTFCSDRFRKWSFCFWIIPAVNTHTLPQRDTGKLRLILNF